MMPAGKRKILSSITAKLEKRIENMRDAELEIQLWDRQYVDKSYSIGYGIGLEYALEYIFSSVSSRGGVGTVLSNIVKHLRETSLDAYTVYEERFSWADSDEYYVGMSDALESVADDVEAVLENLRQGAANDAADQG